VLTVWLGTSYGWFLVCTVGGYSVRRCRAIADEGGWVGRSLRRLFHLTKGKVIRDRRDCRGGLLVGSR
jgi:hypothetical protein